LPLDRSSNLGLRRLGWSIVPILSACAFAAAFAQRPGKTFADSRVELSANPSLFLHQLGQVWSSTSDLGHVGSAQFVGYLFPMAPWFAFAHAIGISMWVTERLWMGGLLALSAWGVVLLMDDLYSRRRGVAHVAAGVLFTINPYVATFGSRATVALLAYVAMPWLMVAAHRGLRQPKRWVWPIVFALVLAAGGGGVNAAFLPWVVAAPALLVLYEACVLERTWADVRGFAWRTALCSVLASAWWVVPVALQSRYGGNFLAFLEQPSAIWSTTSASESLRLLGYWIFYFATGYQTAPQPSVSVASPYLFNDAIVIATFAVPLLAVLGLAWNRGWRYGPFFGLLAVLGVLVMSTGFPEGKPLERLLIHAYYNVGSLQFLRTTYKAAPDVAIGFSCLVGAACGRLYFAARRGSLRVLNLRVPAWMLLVLVLVPVGYGLPFFNGTAIDKRLDYKVPSYWRAALSGAGRTTPPDKRIAILPGQLFSWYRWGETVVSVAPSLTKRPVLIRQATLYADPRSSQLQTAVDDLVQQARLVPGQLRALLDLMAVGEVVVPTDGVRGQSGEPDPATAARALNSDFPPKAATATYGATRRYVPVAGRGGSPVSLPDIRTYRLSGGPGIVRVQPTVGSTVMDGDAEGLTELAAVHGLDTARPLFYAGDLKAPGLRDQVRSGATLVFTDSNRRRFVAGSLTTQNKSATLGPTDPIPASLPSYDLFPSRGSDDQTVALYSGLNSLRTPLFEGLGLSPEDRPYAAFDGHLATAWVATVPDTHLRYIDLALKRPMSIASMRVHAHADILGGTSSLAVSVNGGAERVYPLNFGWTTLPVNSTNVRTLRLRVAGVVLGQGLGGLDEVQIPGLHVQETLRLPTLLAQETRSMDLSHNPISVVLQRTTADFPYRAGSEVEAAQAGNPNDEVDPEPGLERDVTLPAARSFSLDGWASVKPGSSDLPLDRVTGIPEGWRFLSSSRFEGWPIHRASSAFDGNPKTAWVGNFLKKQFAWISVRAPHSFEVSSFKLQPLSSDFAFPTLIQVRASHGYSTQVKVGRDGTVTLPEAIRTTSLRLNILGLREPSGSRELRAVAISEVQIPGLSPPAPHRRGTFTTPCGALTVTIGSQVAAAAVSGTIAELDAGKPLSLQSCGGSTLGLAAGTSHLSAPPGQLMRADHLRLSSPAPSPLATVAAPPPAKVLNPGEGSNGSRRDVRLKVLAPSWLVLGESYSRGWRAWCTASSGRETSLGRPVPIDGFANGWLAPAGCSVARFYFAPQHLADASYLLSAIGGGAMLLALVGGFLLRRRGFRLALSRRPLARTLPPPIWTDPVVWGARPADPVRRLGWTGAAIAGVLAGALGGFLFAVRAGLVIGPVTFAFLVLGLTVRRLLILTGAGLVAVTVAYLVSPSPNNGGFFFYYSLHYITAHWIALGVVLALGCATALTAWDVRAGAEGPATDDRPWPGQSLWASARRLRPRRRAARP
jgi:arabinofuranan 3-O-arabinosyltransferase